MNLRLSQGFGLITKELSFFFFFESPDQKLAQRKLTLLKEHQKKEDVQYRLVHLQAK